MLRVLALFALVASAFAVTASYRTSFPSASDNGRIMMIEKHRQARAARFSAKGSNAPKLPGGMANTVLTWDQTLADASSEFLNKCKWGHDPKAGVGENLYTSAPFSKNPAEITTHMVTAFNAWDKEKENYISNNLKFGAPVCKKRCGHYTQMIWRQTTKIGCAYAGCKEADGLSKDEGFVNPFLIGCRYSPQGNFGDQYVYQQSEADALAPGIIAINGKTYYHPDEITAGHFNWGVVALGVALLAVVVIIAAVVIRRRRVAAAVEECNVELLA